MPSSAADAPSTQALFQHRVWALLAPAARAALAAQCQGAVFAAGQTVLESGQLHERLALLVSGTVALQEPGHGWTVELAPGEWFGAGVTPWHPQAAWQAMATSEAGVLLLPLQAVAEACVAQPELALFFPALPAPAIAQPLTGPAAGLNPLGMPVQSLLRREPVTLPPTASIRETAQLMQQMRISSVLLVQQGYLFGIVTDRDLRNRVLAQGLDSGRPVADIATLAPLTLDAQRPAFEALLLMARHNIHHLPVLDGQRILGLLTATDLTEQHSTSAVYLAGDVYQQTSLAGLVRTSARIPRLQQHLAASDASAYSSGHIVTSITDALTVRLIELAEAQLGPAPVDYVWVAAGSQARSEQTARSDQDNCLVLDNRYNEAAHGAYFQALARFVCDGLAACGYVHCPGEMMAMTDTWRQPQQRWADYFHEWVSAPEPLALMLTCVFFDLRAVHGQAELLHILRHELLRQTPDSSIFLAHMAANALKHRPALGLFGQMAWTRGGAHAGTIDLKHSAIVPIVDLARVFALAAGLPGVNTRERLEQAAQAGALSEQEARDVCDALEFLGKLRIAHQARQLARGQVADNFLALAELSNFERSQLKNAFLVVQAVQWSLGQRYQSGRF